jgi:hypothetical protein
MAEKDIHDRLDDVESLVEKQREIIEEQSERIDQLTAEAYTNEDTKHIGTEPDSSPQLLPSGGQAHKVKGKFSNSNGGVGVYGHNTASSGTTYGVWGEVDSSGGYGIYTPNDTKVDGNFETNGDIDMDEDGDNGFTDIYMGSSGRWFYNPDFSGMAIVGPADADEFGIATDGMKMYTTGGYLSFADDSEQRTAGPVAKGVIDRGGNLVNGYGVESVSKSTSPPAYYITFSTIDYDNDEYVSMITPLEPAIIETGSAGTDPSKLAVQFDDDTGSAISRKFHFVVYEATNTASTQSNSVQTTDSTSSPASKD